MHSPLADTFALGGIAMKYDVTIIGGGPGGYVCAIRCAQLGFRTALIEERHLGGVCLNRGCIPTKALVAATRLLDQARTADKIGISFDQPRIDLQRLGTWKDGIVSTLTSGIATLLAKGGVSVYETRGKLTGPKQVILASGPAITSERIVLATGSSPIEIPGFPFADPVIWSSDDALDLPEIPERLVVIGGGVIGLELATIYQRLGSRVAVIELLPEILSGVDLDRRTIALLKRALKAQGIDLRLKATAGSFTSSANRVVVNLEDGVQIEANRLLISVGRQPNSGGLGLETVGIELDDRGVVPVDGQLKTVAPGVFAIGDLISGPMLAHKASAEGTLLAAAFAGTPVRQDYGSIPQAIFTDPEIASVGLSEQLARETTKDILVGRFPYAALGKALGMREPEGFFQVVADAADHRLLGVQIIGAEASDLISEAVVAIRSDLSLEAIADAVHPHPTLPEGLKEAAENALGRAIHTVNR